MAQKKGSEYLGTILGTLSLIDSLVGYFGGTFVLFSTVNESTLYAGVA